MIQRIRNSRTFKGLCLFMALNILAEIVSPLQAMALTGGPAQPEFGSFTPIGTSDMVDLSSGDMNYNIPLMDVGGYPLNIAYSSGVGMDDEASWVGLGWNLSVGQINNNVRGLSDDFQGDEMEYEDYMKPNITVGGSFKVTPNVFGVGPDGLPINPSTLSTGQQNDAGGPVSVGVTAIYNNYTGFELKRSLGMNVEINKNVSVGFNVESGADGISVSPTVNFNKKFKDKKENDIDLGGKVGCSFNSRQGLSSLSIGMSKNYQRDFGSKMKNKINNQTNGSWGSTIGFTDQIYTPTVRGGMITGSFTVNAALGSEFFGGEAQGQITAYGTVQTLAKKSRKVGAYGYANTEKANAESAVDINREKDGSISVNSSNLPVTNYTYDIHSVQGQGVSGMYRPYRNQVGYVFDTYASDWSTSADLGLEFGVGNAAHFGWDVGVTVVNSHSGLWDASQLNYFKPTTNTAPDYEMVHYKNVGDLSVDQDFTADENSASLYQLFNKVGGYAPVNIPIVGIKFFRSLENKYAFEDELGNSTSLPINSKIHRSKRQVRNQAINNVTVAELQKGIGYGPIARAETALPDQARKHHIGEVQVTRNDGARYIYGLPVYNTVKKEATFATSHTPDYAKGLVGYNVDAIKNKKFEDLPNDKYFNRVTTPAYVHTHLLTSVLSADYQDVDGNGPSDQDLGNYTKFSYSKKSTGANPYKWRVPLEQNKASYNEGLKTEPGDDQGNYVYGEKEIFYIDKIETKTHIAIFHISPRKDAKGVIDEHGGISSSQVSYKLDKISLYSKGDYYLPNGTVNPNAVPIKQVHFMYNYDLCKGVLNNQGDAVVTGTNEISNNKGKLTLKKIYFTYKKSNMGKYTDYEFDYNEDDPTQNPNYNLKGYNCWGNYKPNITDFSNLGAISPMEFPYVNQDNPSSQNTHAAVWSLKEINLPSGGSLKIEYESDDYQYVQDKKAMKMYTIAGIGDANISTDLKENEPTATLYDMGLVPHHKKYLYVKVPETSVINASEIKTKYFQGLKDNLIQFRFLMNMTPLGGYGSSTTTLNEAKFDYVSGYAQLDEAEIPRVFQYGTGNEYYLSIPVKLVEKEGGLIQTSIDNRNPIAKASWQFGRKYLNKHVYSLSPNGDPANNTAEGAIMDIVEDLFAPQTLTNLFEIFAGPNGMLETKGIGRRFIKDKSFVRLGEPTGKKLGGGCRVKSVRMNDVWEKMNGEVENSSAGYKTMNYGQSYEYMLENGKSSGVATYEPVGNKENPLVQPVYSTEKHLLAPDDANYLEEPFGESFFPSPQVTYSRVKVGSLTGGFTPSETKQVKKLHQTGYVVTEFYTTKDYPTIVDQTTLQAKHDDTGVLGSLLKCYSKKQFTASQGYVVHVNDMNGKQKSQRVYAAGQVDAISGVDYIYDNYESNGGGTAAANTNGNRGRLNNKVTVIYPDGKIKQNTIGVEYDVVNDFRENQTVVNTGGAALNTAGFFLGIFPGFVPMVLPKYSRSKDQFHSIATTKVINTFGILKETIAYDAGTKVSTRNLAWDAMTGEVLLTETVDEYNDNYYTFNYPAHWMYKGMGAASLNLGFVGGASSVSGGNTYTLAGSGLASTYLIDGDEIAIAINANETKHGWIVEVQGDYFKIIDKDGNPIITSTGALAPTPFKVIRSGHRNLQSAGIMNVTLMHNPLLNVTNNQPLTNLGTHFLTTANWSDYRIINAGAVDYSDNWPAMCECGASGLSANPYFTNSKGVWRTKSSRTYRNGRNYQASTTSRQEGFYVAFSPFYKLSPGGNWVKNPTQWTFVSEVSKYSSYGFELENKDALNRYSASQYGYNNKFPIAVGSNTKYSEIGFDGFEDYDFNGCAQNSHFSFKDLVGGTKQTSTSHTGTSSIKVIQGQRVGMNKKLTCPQ